MTHPKWIKENVPTAIAVPPRTTSTFQTIVWCAADDSAWICRYPPWTGTTTRGNGRFERYVLKRRTVPYTVTIELNHPVVEVDYQTAIWELLQLAVPERRRSL